MKQDLTYNTTKYCKSFSFSVFMPKQREVVKVLLLKFGYLFLQVIFHLRSKLIIIVLNLLTTQDI